MSQFTSWPHGGGSYLSPGRQLHAWRTRRGRRGLGQHTPQATAAESQPSTTSWRREASLRVHLESGVSAAKLTRDRQLLNGFRSNWGGRVWSRRNQRSAPSEAQSVATVPRAAILKRIAVSLGGLSAAGAAAAGLASASRSSGSSLSSHDREVLEFALKFEQLQTAFYGQALRDGKLTGQTRQFAEIVGNEEQAHLNTSRRRSAAPARRPRFTSATRPRATRSSSRPRSRSRTRAWRPTTVRRAT